MIASILAALASLAFAEPQDPGPPETVRLSGRVVDMRGEGVVAAKVWIVTYAEPDNVLARTTTDGEGFFLFGKAPHRSYWRVWAAAEGTCKAYEQTSPGNSVSVTLHDAVAVSGVLKGKAGKPIANTLVRSNLDARVMFDTTCDAHTDESGHFTLAAVPLGQNQFFAWVDDIGLVTVSKHITGPCKIEMAPTGAATASIKIDIAGLPDTLDRDIAITLLPYTNHSLTYLPPPMRRPLTRGTWQSDLLPDWDYTLYVRDSEFTFEPNRVKAKAGSNPHRFRFTAHSIATDTIACRGSVTHDGKPVPNVVIELSRTNGTNAVRATTDNQGQLTWDTTIPAGQEVRVRSKSDDWVATTTGNPIDAFIRNGQGNPKLDPATSLDVRIERASQVSGQLQLDDGRPAGLFDVKLEVRGLLPEWQSFAYTTTQRDGTFTFKRLRTTTRGLRLAVASPRGSLQSEPFELQEAGARVKLPALRLSPPAIVEGIVRDKQQVPMPGVNVWLRDWDMARNGQRSGSGSVTEVITDRLGRYRFLGVPIGGAYLQIVPPGGRSPSGKATEPFEVEAGKTYKHDLVGDRD